MRERREGSGSRPPLIYVSGPMTSGLDPFGNIRRGLDAADELIRLGYVVICPHEKALGLEILHPRSYDEWLAYDFRCILECDAVYRMPGASTGGDAEVEFARERGIPVYFSPGMLTCCVPAVRP